MKGSQDAMRPRQLQEVTNGGNAPAIIKCDVRKHFGFLASGLVEVERGQLPLNNEDTAVVQPVHTDGTYCSILELSEHDCCVHMLCFKLVQKSIQTTDYSLKGI